tara:strand:+ start:541 stop:672 length:132 start_codon:yes stop_codon:yes gene_type:complete
MCFTLAKQKCDEDSMGMNNAIHESDFTILADKPYRWLKLWARR